MTCFTPPPGGNYQMPYQTPQKERSEANELTNLFQNYSPEMLTYARYRLGGPYNGMAEDVVQESFLALWKNMSILEKIPPEQHKRLLLSIVKCRIVDFFRKELSADKVSIDDGESYFQFPDFSPSIETQMEGKELLDEIRAAIHDLNDTYRSVMEMKYIFHLKESEIAKLLNLSEKNVSVRVYRGRQQLQELLRKRMQEIKGG